MDWIKWRLPPSLQLPFIMQLFFLGGGIHGRFCSTPQFHSAGSGDRCKKMSHGIKGIEKTFTLHAHFFFVCHCSLFSRFELVPATLLLKLFSRGCFGRRHQTHVCSLQWLQGRGISWMCILVPWQTFLHWDVSPASWRTRTYAWRHECQINFKHRRQRRHRGCCHFDNVEQGLKQKCASNRGGGVYSNSRIG